jgi:hypothetical protein
LVALRAAIDFGKFLAIFGAFAPTTALTRIMAWWAVPLRLRKIVNVNEFRSRTRYDLLPVDGFHVAQVVVVEHPTISNQNICKYIFRIESIKIKELHQKSTRILEWYITYLLERAFPNCAFWRG